MPDPEVLGELPLQLLAVPSGKDDAEQPVQEVARHHRARGRRRRPWSSCGRVFSERTRATDGLAPVTGSGIGAAEVPATG